MSMHVAVSDDRVCDLYLRMNNEVVYFPNAGGLLLIWFDIRSL